jgi:hypothetical protein
MRTLIYQLGSPDGRHEMAIGRDDAVLTSFRPGGLLDRIRGVLLRGSFQGASYALMLPAPWNGSKWRVLEHDRDLAVAENVRQGPLKIKSPAAFDVNFYGRALHLEAVDRNGHEFRLSESGQACGGLMPRPFDAKARWYADVEVPEDLPVPVVAFLAWLTREGGKELRRRVR